jgi:hypothetical protein
MRCRRGPHGDVLAGRPPVADDLRLRVDDLEWREVDGRIVALDVRASEYLSINRTGTAVWLALVDGAERKELVASLMSAFAIDEATAGRDLDAFLTSLRERKLLDG